MNSRWWTRCSELKLRDVMSGRVTALGRSWCTTGMADPHTRRVSRTAVQPGDQGPDGNPDQRDKSGDDSLVSHNARHRYRPTPQPRPKELSRCTEAVTAIALLWPPAVS